MKKFDDAIIQYLNINENLLKQLKMLEDFHYGCLYDDGYLTSNIDQIQEKDGWHIVIQPPELFVKNRIGMCHDASIYIDKICTENNITHLCVYIASNLKPKQPTHSFVIIETNNKTWQVIDVFATNNCLWKLPFKSYTQAIDKRIQDWILKDNDKNPDVDVYISTHMPDGGCTFVPYSEKVENEMMRYFTQLQLSDIYEYNSNLLKQYNEKMFVDANKKHKHQFMISQDIIVQSYYFEDVPQSLEDYILEEIDKCIESHQIYIQIPISKIASFLLNDKLKNYMGFKNFLDLLTKSSGSLLIKFIKDESYFAPPVEISKIKIKENYSKQKVDLQLGFIEADYNQFLKQKLKNAKLMNQIYAKINDQIFYRQDWGQIGIGIQYLRQNLSDVIDHQIGHFISFLLRVSAKNHELCRYWSNHKHSDFELINNDLQESQYKKYLLDSDQFKRWSSTTIHRICRTFENQSDDFSQKNILDFYNYILNHEIKHDRKYIANNQKNQEIIKHIFRYESILMFMRTIYEDSFINTDKKEYRNNFTTFKKWLLNSLKNIGKDKNVK